MRLFFCNRHLKIKVLYDANQTIAKVDKSTILMLYISIMTFTPDSKNVDPHQQGVSLSSANTQRELRTRKMNTLRARGIDPFTPSSKRDMHLAEAKELFEEDFEMKESVTLVGFVSSKRGSGKISFASIQDESCPAGFQFVFKADQVAGEEENQLDFKDFQKLIDEGDYIQATGTLQRSQRGEPSLFVDSYRLLTKSLRPLPDKIENIEDKYRRRYLDMKLNPEVREMFKQKSRFWSSTRDFMVKSGFLEVSMPTLEHTTGGAEAEPFVTHHNALDQDFYLRISSELHQKRMLVGGFEKIFDLDKNYRNEGIDDEHLQEYTQMEFYWAYADYNNLMDYCEELMKHVIKQTFGSHTLTYDENTQVDWSKQWPRIPYYDFIKEYGGVDISQCNTVEQLRAKATELNLEYEESDGVGRLIDLIYKKTARPKCIEPVWLIDQPVAVSPLAKRIPGKPDFTQRIQLVAYGSELCNGYSELNDPIDQLERFEEQQRLREEGDGEAMMLDRDYVNALEIGMPPAAGFAYSERLFSMLLRKPIREVTPFPLMRKEKAITTGKNKQTIVAHSVILNTADMQAWEKMNTASHLASSFAARIGTQLFHTLESPTKDGVTILMNIQNAIVIKQATNPKNLHSLIQRAEADNLHVVTFTRDMLKSSDDVKVMKGHASKNSHEIEYLGALIYGPIKKVKPLTEDFDLWS